MLALILTGAGLLAAGSYAASCAWWPYARCWRCDGAGRHARADRKVWRDCRRCKGGGRRIRVGRRLWTWFRS